MLVLATVLFTAGAVVGTTAQETKQQPPHIVFIVSDDSGWNDFGWHNPEIKTPNLDKYAYDGIILNSSYVMMLCSPSRSAFLSGYYPYHTGMQAGVVMPGQTKALPLNIKTLPQYLKTAGYDTHIVGKWHLGSCNWSMTPTERGFDSHVGYFEGAIDYWNKTIEGGYDFWFNKEVLPDPDHKYTTWVFRDRALDIIDSHDPARPLFLYLPFENAHSPLEVPQEYEDMYSHVQDPYRRTYSGMITALDDAVGNITAALEEHGLMDNLLLVFTTDNGAVSGRGGGSNLPLRGGKGTLWEGGTRGPAFVYSKTLLSKTGYVNNQLIHAVDWMPTFLEVAGVTPDTEIDGVSQWSSLRDGTPGPRKGFVYNITPFSSVIREGDYKLFEKYPRTGTLGGQGGGRNHRPGAGLPGDIIGRRQADNGNAAPDTTPTYELYNVRDDPSETADISENHPDIVARMKAEIQRLRSTMVPPQDTTKSPLSDPVLYGGIRMPGWC